VTTSPVPRLGDTEDLLGTIGLNPIPNDDDAVAALEIVFGGSNFELFWMSLDLGCWVKLGCPHPVHDQQISYFLTHRFLLPRIQFDYRMCQDFVALPFILFSQLSGYLRYHWYCSCL
jgi:hypothetical protein